MKFATHRRDSESLLDYAWNRYYDNTTGRFLTPDPYKGSGDPYNPQSWNRYGYGLNDPVGNNDPSGLSVCYYPGDYGDEGLGVGLWGPCPDDGEYYPTGRGAGGGGGSRFAPVNCDTVLPNGETVGDVVRKERAVMQQALANSMLAAALGAPSDPFATILATFLTIALPNGPIDFKNDFTGQANGTFLGDAGNFAYYAIGWGFLPNSLLDAGAGAYGVLTATFGQRKFADLTGPSYSDSSVARVRAPALASDGCAK